MSDGSDGGNPTGGGPDGVTPTSDRSGRRLDRRRVLRATAGLAMAVGIAGCTGGGGGDGDGGDGDGGSGSGDGTTTGTSTTAGTTATAETTGDGTTGTAAETTTDTSTPQPGGTIDDWPMYGHDPGLTGHAPDEPAPTEGVREQWVFETDGVAHQAPAAVGDAVFHSNADFGGGTGRLYAVEAASGDQRWLREFEADKDPSPPVVDGDTVFVGVDEGLRSKMYALDVASGDDRWSVEVGGGRMAATLADGTLFVRSSTSAQLEESNTFALDPASGETRWKTGTEKGGFVPPAVVDGTVFLESLDPEVYALDAASGEHVWTAETPETGPDTPGVHRPPAVADGSVFVGGGTVVALDAATGDRQWTFEPPAPARSSPAVADGTVLVGTDSPDHDSLFALDAASGDVRWSADAGGVQMQPAVADGSVFVGGFGGIASAFDVASGDRRWSFETGGGLFVPPAVAEGTVYVADDDVNLYALTE